MVKKIGVLLFCCMPILASAQGEWKSLGKLAGNWQQSQKQQFEIWQLTGAFELKGKGIRRNHDGTERVVETLLISGQADEGIYYRATVPDQNEGQTIPFLLTEFDRRNLVFENPDHDFPQKIHYQLKGRRKLHVHVSGGGKGFVVEMKKIKD